MVHRSPALKPSERSGAWPILIALAVLEVAWFGWFILEPLPNVGSVAGGKGLSRINLLIRSLPQIVPGLKFSDSYLGIGLEHLSHLENLPSRAPIVLAAGLIVGSSVALGLLILRGLRLDRDLDLFEQVAVGFGLGTIGLGLVTLLLGRIGWLSPALFRAGLAIPIVVELVWRFRHPVAWPRINVRAWLGFGVVVGPFVLIMVLGAMIPCIDFDGLEYHLQGPKEYYQAGRIGFLPHNVYTSMPFGVEMIHLIGMELMNDWWLGALVGQVVIAGFALATAGLIALTALRLGSPRGAWVGAVVYLTTPWVYRLAVLPYVEGPLCYFHAALIWVVIRTWCPEVAREFSIRSSPLLGLVAGGAMATKYPGLISSVIPASAWALFLAWRVRSWRLLAGFSLGLLIVVGPWLGKNLLDTGNPVYPLGYSVFGSRAWSPERDARWSAVHGPRAIQGLALVRSALEVAGRSDWQSPLYVALAPLAWLLRKQSKSILGLSIFSAYLFMTWWLLTHRLDRFWLPILPGLAVLAGLGSDWSRSRTWGVLLAGLMVAGVGSNLVYCSTELAGLNDWTADLAGLRRSIPELLNPPMARLDTELPDGARPLMVGQAGVFHLNHRAVYNTVFDEEILELITGGQTPAAARQGFERRGITHVYVDWSEIDRYRSPGNYGFTSYVTAEVFANLVRTGVLNPGLKFDSKHELYEVRSGPAP